MNVDLPAPFSPTTAWTSPRLTVRSTSVSARTPGNVLVIRRIWRIGGCVAMGAPRSRMGRPSRRAVVDGTGDVSESQLLRGEELRVHQGGLDGVGGDHLRRQEAGGHDLHRVVVGRGGGGGVLLTGGELLHHGRRAAAAGAAAL